jgi:hypothetical protein
MSAACPATSRGLKNQRMPSAPVRRPEHERLRLPSPCRSLRAPAYQSHVAGRIPVVYPTTADNYFASKPGKMPPTQPVLEGARPWSHTCFTELAASFPESRRCAPWPWWRSRAAGEGGVARKMRGTLGQREGRKGHDHGICYSCASEADWPHTHGFSLQYYCLVCKKLTPLVIYLGTHHAPPAPAGLVGSGRRASSRTAARHFTGRGRGGSHPPGVLPS